MYVMYVPGTLQLNCWMPDMQEAGDEDAVFDPAPGICMQLTDTAESRAMWPHSFQMEYQVRLQAGNLSHTAALSCAQLTRLRENTEGTHCAGESDGK